MKNFINKFSYKLQFTEYDLLVIKVIIMKIITIIKKTYLQFISTKNKRETIDTGGRQTSWLSISMTLSNGGGPHPQDGVTQLV